MSAVPRWSHRDPVEGGNPFATGDPRRAAWAEATAVARAALERHDDALAASDLVTPDPRNYGRRLIDLATARFDTWARRGLAAVDSDLASPNYEQWLKTYVANWRPYVAETCPHVGTTARDELHSRITARATHWTTEAQRTAVRARSRRGGTAGSA